MEGKLLFNNNFSLLLKKETITTLLREYLILEFKIHLMTKWIGKKLRTMTIYSTLNGNLGPTV